MSVRDVEWVTALFRLGQQMARLHQLRDVLQPGPDVGKVVQGHHADNQIILNPLPRSGLPARRQRLGCGFFRQATSIISLLRSITLTLS